MIREAEVRRLAGQWGMDPMLVDLDYALGCFLAALYGQDWAEALLFKGGTCLRKCYYTDYRFSEDLDFTATERLRVGDLERRIRETMRIAEEAWQFDFGLRPLRVETIEDDCGKETYRARLYYRGPLRRAGDPRAIRLDVTLDEVVVFPPVLRPIIHPYSDAPVLSATRVSCYDLREVLVEKVRALLGQRRYAIARDLYDMLQLRERVPLEVSDLAAVLPDKLSVKGLSPVLDLQQVRGRKDAFRLDWEKNLVHLLPHRVEEFDRVWERGMEFLNDVAGALDQ